MYRNGWQAAVLGAAVLLGCQHTDAGVRTEDGVRTSGSRPLEPRGVAVTERRSGEVEPGRQAGVQEGGQLLQGNFPVLGRVEAVTAQQIKVDIGEVQPRYIPLRPAQEKQFGEIHPGDALVIVLNDQNLIVDYHPVDDERGGHRVISGQIAQDLTVGHDHAVLRTAEGKEETHEIRSQARSKIASIPVGIDALFLIDETNQIADATFADQQAVKEAGESFREKSPLKGAQRQVSGRVVQGNRDDRITIRTPDGKEQQYELRPPVQDKIAKLSEGEPVILLVDPSDKVFDIAMPPGTADR